MTEQHKLQNGTGSNPASAAPNEKDLPIDIMTGQPITPEEQEKRAARRQKKWWTFFLAVTAASSFITMILTLVRFCVGG